MRRDAPQLLGECLGEYLRRTGLSKAIDYAKVCTAWNEVVGSEIASVTLSKFYKDGVLSCRMGSSVVRTQLGYGKRQLIGSLNRKLGGEYIKDIKLS